MRLSTTCMFGLVASQSRLSFRKLLDCLTNTLNNLEEKPAGKPLLPGVRVL